MEMWLSIKIKAYAVLPKQETTFNIWPVAICSNSSPKKLVYACGLWHYVYMMMK